ncbi:MAG: rod shape-determining protein MreC [bacterium]
MKKIFINLLFLVLLVSIYYGKNYIYVYSGYNNNVISTYVEKNDYLIEEEFPFDFEYTKVLYRDIYDFSNEITIYKGKNKDLEEDMLVIDDNALVGIIKSVSNTTSVVSLLTNNDTNISVRVGDAYGILKYESGILMVTSLTGKSFSNGDLIYTSGYSKYYEGVVIGNIIKQDELYLVNLIANFKNINNLVVIKDMK